MRHSKLVLTRYASLLAAFSILIFTCAVPAAMQLADGAGQGLPDDWPQTITVAGMGQVEGLVQGDNNISYSINVISQQGSDINFQVNSFCVYNPVSAYAILNVPDKPLMGVLDQDKKSLQIDFSPLSAGVQTEIIDKADVDKVLMQDSKSLILNTAMTVDSTDSSGTDFSITDMSLLQPDGVLDQFSLPGPIPAELSPDTDRFSTLGFNELAGVLQQNYVCTQENTYVNVVNVVNEVNVINLVNCGDYGGYGCYGGDDGFGGCDAYGGYAPCNDPLPLANPAPVAPFSIPGDVPVYHGGGSHSHSSGFGDRAMGRGGRSNAIGDNTLGQGLYSGDAGHSGAGGYGGKGSTSPVSDRQPISGSNRLSAAASRGNTRSADGDKPGTSASTNTNTASGGQSRPETTTALREKKVDTGSPAVSGTGHSTPIAMTAAGTKAAKNGARQSSTSARTVTKTNTANTKAPAVAQARQPTPAARTVSKSSAPAAKTVKTPQMAMAARPNTQPVRTAAVKQASSPRATSRSGGRK